MNKESLWARVIMARHSDFPFNLRGLNRGSDGGRFSGWWAKILAAAGRGDEGFFWKNLSRKLGKGNSIRFWYDSWAGERALKDSFHRIFQLYDNKQGSVRDMGTWIQDSRRWEIPWRRVLSERGLARVNELLQLIQNFSICVDVPDEWKWGSSPDGLFSVKAVYATLSKEYFEESVQG